MRKIISVAKGKQANIVDPENDHRFDVYDEETGRFTFEPDVPFIRDIPDNIIGDRVYFSVCNDSEEILAYIESFQDLEDLDWRDATDEEKIALKNQRVSESKSVNSETRLKIREEFSVDDELKIYRTDDADGKARIAEIVAEGTAKKTALGY